MPTTSRENKTFLQPWYRERIPILEQQQQKHEKLRKKLLPN